MGRTVADVALLLTAISGPDPRVSLALDAPPPALSAPSEIRRLLTREMRGVRVAWSADLDLPLDPAVRAVLAPARQVLADLGCEVIDATPDLAGADEGFRIWRAQRYATAFGPLLARHPDQVGPNVAWNVRRGLELTAADLSRATQLLAALAERISAFFETVNVLACPVSQVPPFDVGLDWVHEIDGVELHSYLDWMRSAYLISATGLPAISVPAGFTTAGGSWGSSPRASTPGLPVGLQLVGRRREDWPLLAVAHAFESATRYGEVPPPVLASAPQGGGAGS